MGVLDSFRNLLGGSGRTTVPIVLRPGEIEQLRVVGSALFGGMAKVGGDLVVTDQRVLFTPLNTGDLSTLLKAGLKAADAPGGASAVVGWLQGQVDAAAASTDRVVGVRAGADGGWLKPPTVVFVLADGRTMEFGVLESLRTATGSSKNRAARDQLVALVTAR